MRLQFTYTPEDYLEANRVYLFRTAPARERLLHKIWVPFGIIVVIAGVNWLVTKPGFVYGTVVSTLGVVSIVWGWLKSWPYLSRHLTREFARTPGLQGTMEMELDDHGMRVRTPVAYSDLAWEAFTSFAETDSLFLIFGHPRLFYMVPKRAVDAAELDDFRAMLNRKLATIDATDKNL